MGIPAFSCSDEQHAVSGVPDDIAPVVKVKSEFLIPRRSLRKNNIQVVVAACAALLQIHALILKESEGDALVSRNGVNRQSPGELEGEDALRSRFRAQTHARRGVHRVIGGNCGLNGIVQCPKGRWRRRNIWNSVRGPDVIKSVTASFVKLSEKEWLVALRVKHDIERARDRAFQPGVKAGPGAGRQPFSENAQSVAGVKLSRRGRSEEHTSELQSHHDLVCRLLLEKKK